MDINSKLNIPDAARNPGDMDPLIKRAGLRVKPM
jgi:hypothetical protein